MTPFDIRVLGPAEVTAQAGALGAILADCVADGASLNFLWPYGEEDGRRFYAEKIARQAAAGETIVLGAWLDGELTGTAQLGIGQPPNQQHRADVKKVLVHRRGRGRGMGAALMAALETLARAHGRSLLCLDTAQGTGGDRLYRHLGWTMFGVVPKFARDPDGTLRDCCFYYKELAP